MTTITLAALVAALALPSSGAADPDQTFVRYGKVVDQVRACALDGQARHLSVTKRRRCPALKRRYSLYSLYGAPSILFLRCKTSRCPKAPDGVPNPRSPIPNEAVVVY